jgi:S1-C subfamily serine protease
LLGPAAALMPPERSAATTTGVQRLVTRLLTIAVLFAALGGLAAWSSGSPARGDAPRTRSTGVVVIETDLAYQGNQAAGTGMVLTPSGEVLTNNHVIAGATTIRVIVPDSGRSYRAKVVGYSVADDVAVLQLSDASGLATIETDTSKPSFGAKVTALGNAGGTGSLTPAAGTVTGVDKSITASDDNGDSERLTGLIETDANVQPGDSGGALLNAADRVIGMNTAASTGNRGFAGFGDDGGNDGYAIPIAHALAIAKRIESGQGSSTVHVGGTAWLGVQVSSSAGGSGYGYDPNGGDGYDPNGDGSGDGYGYDPSGTGDGGGGSSTPTGGAVIAGVVQGGPADDAGLAEGDTITAVDGHAVASPDALTELLGKQKPGDEVPVAIVDQNGSARTVTVTLGSGPAK